MCLIKAKDKSKHLLKIECNAEGSVKIAPPENCPLKTPLPPRKLPPMKIPTYEGPPPSENRPQENYPQKITPKKIVPD